MNFDSAVTGHDPVIKYLLTQRDFHSRQIAVLERTCAKSQVVLAAPPHDFVSYAHAEAEIARCQGALVGHRADVEAINQELVKMGVSHVGS